VLEFLAPAQEAVAAELIRQWKQDQGDAELSMVKAAALAVDEDYRARLPWWDGIDLNQGNVRQSVDGRLTLVDVFCMDGAALYGQILQDPAVVRRLIPADQRRHLLEIPYLALERGCRSGHRPRPGWACPAGRSHGRAGPGPCAPIGRFGQSSPATRPSGRQPLVTHQLGDGVRADPPPRILQFGGDPR
jgi:hypothetical protein